MWGRLHRGSIFRYREAAYPVYTLAMMVEETEVALEGMNTSRDCLLFPEQYRGALRDLGGG